MSDLFAILSLVFAAGLAYAGCAGLALSQKRNWRAVMGSEIGVQAQHMIRLAGIAILLAALGVCIARDGAGFAVLCWALLVAVGALAVAMTLTYFPSRARPAQRAAPARKSPAAPPNF